ncbi:hypothetical protein YTPLAS72_31210 [Nitrospira sp.]|nr:hypothetical protein YTPLAS72_31210 [Nitrospira sp.]
MRDMTWVSRIDASLSGLLPLSVLSMTYRGLQMGPGGPTRGIVSIRIRCKYKIRYVQAKAYTAVFGRREDLPDTCAK